MVEQSLVYIHSVKPARRFVGCGVLIEGGYVATCRHVWDMATDAAANVEPGQPLRVEVEYPRSKQDGGTVRRPAQLVDACKTGANPALDLVLLLPEEIPNAGVTTLQLASHERFQVGEGYAIAGLVREEKKPNTPRDAKIKGTIADHENTDGLREFTGSNPSAFWFQRGSSGSPVFVEGGQQLAGIVSLSELGANEGKSRLHEAFVVPGMTIRAHVVRLAAAPVARGQHLDVAELQPVLDALGVEDVPLAEIPSRLMAFIEAARARAAEQVAASSRSVDIDATIAAARARLGNLDTTGAQTVLRAKIAEVEEMYRQRLIPLLEEKAAVEQLSYDYEAAKATLNQLLALDPDRVRSWIEFGDLGVITGSLGAAAIAFNEALAAARRTGNEWDESAALNSIGDVLEAQGNLSEALKSFRDGLAIADRLARASPDNAGPQRELSVSYDRIGDVLVAQGNLPEALKSFRESFAIAKRLAQSDPGNARWQRDLSISFDHIGDVMLAQGKLAAALKSFRDSLAIAERVAQTDPDNLIWQGDLSASYDRIGDVMLAQGKLAAALKSFRDSLAIRERLVQSDPGNAVWQRDLSVSCDHIGDVLLAQGQLPEALKSFGDSVSIVERLTQSDPGNTEWQRDLAVSYEKIGDVLVEQLKPAEALQSFRRSLEIAERLARSDPDNPGWQFDLVGSNWKLAQHGDKPARRFAFIIATLQKMKKENRLTPAQAKWLPEAKKQLAGLTTPR
jgi:tetratricopeptide (TPR) repeat protein